MKLLLDQGLPRSAAELLRQKGLDAVHTGECGLSVASDGGSGRIEEGGDSRWRLGYQNGWAGGGRRFFAFNGWVGDERGSCWEKSADNYEL